jgi:hypothetical protein
MDRRYRFSWLALLCFCDVRRIHFLIINSFCYHLKDHTVEETKWCGDVLGNTYSQLFFQQVIMWYIALNLVRLDRFSYNKYIGAKKAVDKKDESN